MKWIFSAWLIDPPSEPEMVGHGDIREVNRAAAKALGAKNLWGIARVNTDRGHRYFPKGASRVGGGKWPNVEIRVDHF